MNKLDVKWTSSYRWVMGLALAAILSACSTMPEAIQYDITQEVSVQSIHQGKTTISGQTVRWGGVITQVINNEQGTWVEVLALQLNDIGRPSNNRLTNEGRFIAKIDQFLDPEVYQQGYSFTAIGKLADKIDGKIGEFKYSYPTINVEGHYLWPKYSQRTQHYVMPGYWYYGFHSRWHFGYNYYGYGIRHRYGLYYPYYPLYGHMTRRITPIAHHRRGVFIPQNDKLWEQNTQRLTRVGREARALTRQAAHNKKYRNQTDNRVTKNSTNNVTKRKVRPSRSNSYKKSNRTIKTVTKKIN